MLELAMLVMGIIVLIRGKMSLGKKKEVRGPIARVVGLIMVAPVPIVIAYAVLANKGVENGPFGELFVVEIIAVLCCFTLAMILAYSNAELKSDQSRSRRGRFEDDYDDRDDTRDRDDDRPRSRSRDDEYDDRPRRRERDDEYDDRPRSRDRDDDYDDRVR